MILKKPGQNLIVWVENEIKLGMYCVFQLDHFCNGEEHDLDKPTKHNILCDQKPVWQVIQESPDFAGVKPMTQKVAPPTKFQILRPEMARFALVLDTSGSMNNHRRLERVQQSASDWLNFDVQNGSSVAIVTFA